MKTRTISKLLIIASALALTSANAWASSHREAPSIAQDPCADNTDVYMFISPNDPDKVVVVANYIPLLIPSSGPNFYSFCDSVAYDIHFDNDGDARTDIKYRFRFDTTVQNGDTFLYNVGAVAGLQDPNLNVRQTYRVIRIEEDGDRNTIASDVPVAPWHVGDRSFPGGSYDSVAAGAVYDANGTMLFAGPRDEAFFVDLFVFDLLGVGGAAPTTDGINVMSLVMEIPITELTADGNRPADAGAAEAILGVHATASRKRKRILRRNRAERNRGRFIQVSRLAWPLINEVVIPLKDKDKFNRSRPKDDLANIGSYVLFPELNGLLTAVLGLPCPAPPAEGRTDIVALLSPNGVEVADLMRINIAQGQTYANSAFPNGRTLSDDVTDTLLTVICGAGTPVGDGVDGNDLAFEANFPYIAAPHSGHPLP